MLIMRYKKLVGLYALVSLVYLIQAAFLSSNNTVLGRYDLTWLQTKAIILIVALVYVAISFVALSGYLGLRHYSETIHKSRDGEAFRLFSKGIFCLTIWLPLSAIISMGTASYADTHRSSAALMSEIRNYSNLVIVLPGFWLILEGSRKLLLVVKRAETSFPQSLAVALISFSAIYTTLVLNNRGSQYPSHVVFSEAYYIPTWLIVATIIIPRLIGWYWAVRAVYNVYLYRGKMKAPIYRQALSRLVGGLTLVIITTLLLRSSQAGSSKFGHASLAAMLIATVILLTIMGVGYLYIARGAQGLQKIEEI